MYKHQADEAKQERQEQVGSQHEQPIAYCATTTGVLSIEQNNRIESLVKSRPEQHQQEEQENLFGSSTPSSFLNSSTENEHEMTCSTLSEPLPSSSEPQQQQQQLQEQQQEGQPQQPQKKNTIGETAVVAAPFDANTQQLFSSTQDESHNAAEYVVTSSQEQEEQQDNKNQISSSSSKSSSSSCWGIVMEEEDQQQQQERKKIMQDSTTTTNFNESFDEPFVSQQQLHPHEVQQSKDTATQMTAVAAAFSAMTQLSSSSPPRQQQQDPPQLPQQQQGSESSSIPDMDHNETKEPSRRGADADSTPCTSTTTPSLRPTPKHEEYVDYTCSTSLEQLVRQVETYFRSWHIDQGADRHISHTNSSEPTTEAVILTMINSNEKTKCGDSSSSSSSHHNSDPNSYQDGSDPFGGMPLRCVNFVWTISFHVDTHQGGETKVSAPVELQLALWDDMENGYDDDDDDEGERHEEKDENSTTSNTSLEDEENNDMGNVDLLDLPLSLRLHRNNQYGKQRGRVASGRKRCNSIWSNLSTVFGIGQHVTLTPVFKNVYRNNNSDSSSHSDSDTQFSRDFVQQFLHTYAIPSVSQRHKFHHVAASATVSSILSQWLQTALNLAAVETNCQLPVFGWWGSYNQNHNQRRQGQEQQQVPVPVELAEQPQMVANWSSHLLQQPKQPATSPSQLLTPPPTIRRTFKLGLDSHPCNPDDTLHTLDTESVSDIGQCSTTSWDDDSTSHAASFSSTTLNTSSATSQHQQQLQQATLSLSSSDAAHQLSDMHVGVPTWLHETWTRSMTLLPDPSASGSPTCSPIMSNHVQHRCRAMANSVSSGTTTTTTLEEREDASLNNQQLPPLLAGTCHCGDDPDNQYLYHDSDTNNNGGKKASFWLGTLPPGAAPLSTFHFKLATCGDLLRRYCPPITTTTVEDVPTSVSCLHERPLVDLWHARHVYCWEKHSLPSLDYTMDYGNGSSSRTPQGSPRHGNRAYSPSLSGCSGEVQSSWRATRSAVLWVDDCKACGGGSDKSKLTFAQLRKKLNHRYLQCHLLELVSNAAGSSDVAPLWGPVEDPICSLRASLTWQNQSTRGPVTKNDDSLLSPKLEEPDAMPHQRRPLVQLPVKKLPYHELSEEDRRAADAMERDTLNPLRAVQFTLEVQYDTSVIQTPLAAMQHCMLAALIRTSTLPMETLLKNLTDTTFWEQRNAVAADVLARKLAKEAPTVGTTTSNLVEAMDWENAIKDLLEPEQAQEIVRNVFSASASTSAKNISDPTTSIMSLLKEEEGFRSPLFEPLAKAAPYGRLFSILCAYISRVRSPSSMTRVFCTFVRELRRKWDFRESLPNMMDHLPGFDSIKSQSEITSSNNEHPNEDPFSVPPSFTVYLGNQGDDSACLSNEYHCLIGQKLQVFHMCLETVIAEELSQHQQQLQGHSGPDGRTVASGKQQPRRSMDYESVPPVIEASPRNTAHSLGRFADEDEDGYYEEDAAIEHEQKTSRGFDDTTILPFDEIELSGGIHDTGMDDDISGDAPVESMLSSQRRGARCPVEGQFMVGNGGNSDVWGSEGRHQVYAPYLQRPSPLTDDMVAERQELLEGRTWCGLGSGNTGERSRGRWNSSSCDRQHSPSLSHSESDQMERLKLAQMMERPKLVSDMSAFKAANPGCQYEDFLSWYGEPKLRFQDMSSSVGSSSGELQSDHSQRLVELKIAFWNKTWDEAPSVPASAQEPLFRASDVVEIVLDCLETLHPAILISSVMATNLSNAYYSLVLSATVGADLGEDATQLPTVETSFIQLRRVIETTVRLLSSDSVPPNNMLDGRLRKTGSSNAHDFSGSSLPTRPDVHSFVSLETLASCEMACRVTGENEVLLSNALSLLHKFPHQYQLVDQLLLQHQEQRRLQQQLRQWDCRQQERRNCGGSAGDFSKMDPSIIVTTKDIEDESLRKCITEALAKSPRHNLRGSSDQSFPQQPTTPNGSDSLPPPVLREYMLRNVNPFYPCQLCVRWGDGRHNNTESKSASSCTITQDNMFGGLMIAIKRTEPF